MAKRSGAPIADNLDQVLMEWMIISTMNLPGILAAFKNLRHLKNGGMFGISFEEDEPDDEHPKEDK